MASDWPLPQYARPSDDYAIGAVVSVAAGVENSTYPVQNVVSTNPAKPGKFTGTSGTLRFTFTGNKDLSAIAIINHNIAGSTVTLTNGSGLSVVVPIAADGSDNIGTNSFKDFSTLSLAQRTDDVWDLAITGSSFPIGIGEVLLLNQLRDMPLKWGFRINVTRLFGGPGLTFGGSRLQYDKLIKIRRVSALIDLQAEEADIRELESVCTGSKNPFLFIPDEEVNDCIYMQFERDTFSYAYDNPGITTMPLSFIEMSSGPTLF